MLFREKRLIFNTYKEIFPYLKEAKSILDVGAGSALVADFIQKNSKAEVECIDVIDISRCSIKPILFDGKHIPFPDNSFDLVICCFVLHHTPFQKELLIEMKRVSKGSLLVLEDVASSWFDWPFLFIHRIISFFTYHSRSMKFRSNAGWKTLFSQLNLKLVEEKPISHWRDLCFPASRKKYLLAKSSV